MRAATADQRHAYGKLDEARAGIDRLDRGIVRLVAERGGFAERAALKAPSAEVESPGRVEQVVVEIRALAAGAGLEPRVAEAACRAARRSWSDR